MTLRDFLDRYGVTIAVIGMLALVIAILPGNAPSETASRLASGAGGGETDLGGGTDGGSDGLTSGPAAAGGRAAGPGGSIGSGTTPRVTGPVGKAIFGQGDCRPDGRESGFSVYSPPCVRWEGGNGGATAQGVFPDKIVVVRWVGQVDPATQAILEANKLADDEETRANNYEGFRRYANQHTITYGREVVIQKLNASGPSDDDRAMRADAIKIAGDIKAFAVIEGTPDAPIPMIMAKELAQRGVICMCTSSLTSNWYQENPPYIFGTGLPTTTEYALQIGEFVGKRLKGGKAEWAGDEVYPPQAYKSKERKFGLLYLTGVRDRVEPEGRRAGQQITAELARYGVKVAVSQGYLYDPGRNQNDISTIIAKYKNAGVTTLITYVDPLSPILITKEATRQQWFPEWFITGSGLSDTTTAGRLYDQAQWNHAFGISPLWVTWANAENSGPYRSYYHGMPEAQPGDEGALVAIYSALVTQVFVGIHLAGPVLTRDTFSQAMFRYPPTGGKPAAPLIYWTRQYPTAIKDFTEVWWDGNRPGDDERGEAGTGMMIKVDGAKRYRPGQWPRTKPLAFVENGKEMTVSDDPKLSGDFPHDSDGHTHVGKCKSCPGFQTKS